MPLLVIALLLACGRDRSDPERGMEQAIATTHLDEKSPAAPPSLKGLEHPVAPFKADPQQAPKQVSSEDVLALTASGTLLYGVVSGQNREAPDDVVAVNTMPWSLKKLGHIDAPATLLPFGDELLVASMSGLDLIAHGKKSRKLHEGTLTSAVIAENDVYWSDCPEDRRCTIGCTELRTGKSLPATKARFDVVHDLAVWNGTVWVAGRHRDPREGVSPSTAEQNATARWIMSGGGTKLPAGARYAPGFLAEIDEKGEVKYQDFPTQRPVEIVRDGETLLVLTEGTPGKMFSDGTLFRIDATGEWRLLATGLSMPDDLTVNSKRVCWNTMPAKKFEIQCWSKSTGKAQALVSQDWNVLSFADDGAVLTFSVLTKGTYRLAER